MKRRSHQPSTCIGVMLRACRAGHTTCPTRLNHYPLVYSTPLGMLAQDGTRQTPAHAMQDKHCGCCPHAVLHGQAPCHTWAQCDPTSDKLVRKESTWQQQ